MNTFTTHQRDEEFDAYPDEPTAQLPRRRRRQFLTRRSAALGALVTCAIGFYAGIRVEKGQLSGSPASATAGGGAAGARGGTGAGSRAGLASLFAGAGRTGGPGAGAGAGAGAGNASFGTVASVHGETVYVTEASGNTVKVKLSSATKVSKTQSVSRGAIHPGDTVVVQGVSGSGGTVTAASVTDSGTRGAGGLGFGGAGAGSGSSTGGSTGSGSGGGKSAVGSLFSSGG
jgi:hypothetical protein